MEVGKHASLPGWRKDDRAMPCEGEKYWQYSRECTRQALEAETPELRDQLLELARMWTEAALCEELNAKGYVSPLRLPELEG
jgi:hypothetical protein